MQEIQILGILNVTPDSINRDGVMMSPDDYVREAAQLFKAGAAIIDVGAQATNPYVEPITAEEEWTRLDPVLPKLIETYPGRISLDTFNPDVAEKALMIGKVILNDVTMFYDSRMIELAVRHQVRCIVSHLPPAAKGNVRWAHDHASVDSIEEVLADLLRKRREMINAGVKPENIILDPGIGFGKTPALDRKLIEFAQIVGDKKLLAKIDPESANESDIKVAIGASQKRVIANYFANDRNDPNAKKSDAANQQAFQIAQRTGAYLWRAHKPEIYR